MLGYSCSTYNKNYPKEHSMKIGMKNLLTTALAFFMILAITTAAGAQDKMQKCKDVRVVVDVQNGNDWTNSVYELALLEGGGGWVIASGDLKGKNVPAKKGQKLRFNFNDGHNHMVDVKCTSKSDNCKVKEGSRPAIVLVDVTGSNTTAAIHFDITGSPNSNAKLNDCPSGNFYLDIE